jgi:hypothetical protein
MSFWEDAGQCQGNLLGRPALPQEVAHQSEQDAIAVDLARWAALLVSPLGASACGDADVAAGLDVTPQLPGDGAGRTTQDLGYGANAVLLLGQTGQRHALFRLELSITPGRGALHLRTLLGGRCCTSDLNPP